MQKRVANHFPFLITVTAMVILGLLIIYDVSAVYVGPPQLLTGVNVSKNCSMHGVPVALTGSSLITAKGREHRPEITMNHGVVTAPTRTTSSIVAGSTSYMSIVNTYRAKLGLTAFTHDATLEANALKTCIDGNGHMAHEFHSGTHAQVLADGDMHQDFERIFVGGWLCERPDMRGLDGICTKMSVGWYYTSTGHADILTSNSYTKIGCATFSKITGCDLA
jgi:hypothetical protein